MGTFDFMFMASHEQRVIGTYEGEDFIVDTAAVNDGTHPYETGVQHPRYNPGGWVIVEAYDTEVQAYEGHDRWVKTMTTQPLPDELVDCANSLIAQLQVELCGIKRFPRKNES
jgi:hypothetical protein